MKEVKSILYTLKYSILTFLEYFNIGEWNYSIRTHYCEQRRIVNQYQVKINNWTKNMYTKPTGINSDHSWKRRYY